MGYRHFTRSGVTLIELLVFAAIFSAIAVGFLGVLVVVTRIQVRQTGGAQVNQESQFLLQTIQRYVEQSSVVEEPETYGGNGTEKLVLRMASTSEDSVWIDLWNANSGGTKDGRVYLHKPGGPPQALTSNKVRVPGDGGLRFVRYSNPGGHDSVSVVFAMEYNTQNVQQMFSRVLRTSIARVTAATFDSDVVPSGSGKKLGTPFSEWSSINDIIYFDVTIPTNKLVGIGTQFPKQRLDVYGGLRLYHGSDISSRSSCDSDARGTIWMTQEGINTTDTLSICVKLGDDTYNWQRLY